MNSHQKLSGAAIAAAAAGLLLSGSAWAETQPTEEAKVHCYGINACKGQTACATAKNSCDGKNSCKGQGWLSTTAKDCQDKGGKAG
jgi:uncharacterized membrane protein